MLIRCGIAILAIASCSPLRVSGAELRLVGSIEGQVRNSAGVGQMGAVVALSSRLDRPIQRVITDPQGRFRFDGLFPDSYNIRVSLSSFLPAYKENIPVKAGLDSFLNVQLANIFSSIELTYRPPGQSGLLAEDWKYVLRTSATTRPVLRMAPAAPTKIPGVSSSPDVTVSARTSPRGMVRVSAGESAGSAGLGHEADLGTAFALATTVGASNELQLSGNFGMASAQGTPSGAFRTRYTRNGNGGLVPELQLTVRQASLRGTAGAALLSGPASGRTSPMLRTMSLGFEEQARIGENLLLEYGGLVEAVVFLDRLTFLSPYARISYEDHDYGTLRLAYSSGAPPLNLLDDGVRTRTPIEESISGLGMFPRVSLRDGRPRVQGTDVLEAGYSRKVAPKTTIGASAYVENVRDLAMALSGGSSIGSGDVLPDLSSDGAIYNLGSYRGSGYMATVQHKPFEALSVSVSYGRGTTLIPRDGELGDSVRSRFNTGQRQWASARLSGMVPGSGTTWSASYGWTPSEGLAPNHAFLTQGSFAVQGLNMQVRQSLPALGMPGRLEMSAEVRNLLAQGYLPVATSAYGGIVLMQFPRIIRGGFSFIF